MPKSRKANHKSNRNARPRSSATQRTGSAPPRPAQASAMEAKPLNNQMTRQTIEEAAYFLWRQRGGNELVNWLEAEAMIRRGETVRAK